MGLFPCSGGVRDRNAGVSKAVAECEEAGRVANSFVTVEGRGVGVTEEGDLYYDVDSTDSIRVSARSGWLVNGNESVTLTPSSGGMCKLSATSRVGEEKKHVHFFPRVTTTNHVTSFKISAQAPRSQIAMYALPATGTVVSASATQKIVEKGVHHWTRRTLPCECGEPPPEPSIEEGDVQVVPDHYEWTATAANLTLNAQTWKGWMTKGKGQEIDFSVTATRKGCTKCTCQAQAKSKADVFELSIKRPDYLGLDMTDAMKGKHVKRDATANIDPAPKKDKYGWTNCGRCSFIGATDKKSVTYGGDDKTGGSESYLAEPLTVAATAWNDEGLSASANCTTNFTVVKVDVELDKIGESEDETALPEVYYIADRDDGGLSTSGFRHLKQVAVTCMPIDLPAREMVDVGISSYAELYEIVGTNEAIAAKSSYPCGEIGGVKFGIHGHGLSVLDVGELMTANHEPSEAKDFGRVKVVPPPPLEILNVRFVSPSGLWPYDPVWDDPEYMNTVDGTIADECAYNEDEAIVRYVLNRDAKSVAVRIYEDGIGFGSLIFEDDALPYECSEYKWKMPANLPVGHYYAEIVAVERELVREAVTAESNRGYVQRYTYFVSNATDGMIGSPYRITIEEVQYLNNAINGVEYAFSLAGFLKNVPKLLSMAFTVFSGVETVSSSMFIPVWYKDNTLIYTALWHQTRCRWQDGRYTEPWAAYPESWEVGHIDITYTTGHSATDTITESNYYTKENVSIEERGVGWPWGKRYSRGLLEPKIAPCTK